MKVLCSGCEAAEARVLCCADEAALCERCDRDVHAANRLAGKHHRLPLLSAASQSNSPAAVAAPNCEVYGDWLARQKDARAARWAERRATAQ